MKRIICALLIACICIQSAWASQLLKIGLLEPRMYPPVDSIATNVWRVLSDRLNVQYQMVDVDSLQSGYQQLTSGQIDVLIGPLKSQPHNKNFRYLNSYIQDNLGVIVPKKMENLWWDVFPALHASILWLLLIALISLLIFGALIWALERKKNEDFQRKGVVRGVGLGFWFALVTMTTVGYGDRVPKSLGGRILASVWMLWSLLMITLIIAVVTAQLTDIKMKSDNRVNLSNLKNEQALYIKGNEAAEKLIVHYGARPVAVAKVSDAMNMLEKKEYSVGFINRIQARYFIKHHPQIEVALTEYRFPMGDYTFAVRENNPFTVAINALLFNMSQTGELRKIETAWLGAGGLPDMRMALD